MQTVKLTAPSELSNWITSNCNGPVALDTETTGLTREDKIISFALSNSDNTEIAFCTPNLLPELAAHKHEFIFHNANFDIKMLAWHGLDFNYKFHDTITMHHLLDENASHKLGDVVLDTFGDGYKKEFWDKYDKAEDAPEDELLAYNAKDVHYTHKLYSQFSYALKESYLDNLYASVIRGQKQLILTEIRGIKVNLEYLMEKGVELKTRIDKLIPGMRFLAEEEINSVETNLWIAELNKRKTLKGKAGVAKPEFSFDSTKQLMELIYGELKLPVQKNEKTKKPSVDFDSLELIKHLHPVVALLQEYRDLQKVYGTYIQGTLEKQVDCKIYPSFNVSGTRTGRLSHQNPNMGNLPRTGGVRGIFIPDPGHVFISSDFSQLEVRISAHFTKDKNLLKIVNEGASQHDITAESLKIERQLAKTLNFAMQYGASTFKIEKVLEVDKRRAQEIYDKYWNTYSGQRDLMQQCKDKVDAGEDIISPFMRRRRFERNPKRRPWDKAYRQAWNALVQGTGSDLCLIAFYEISEWLIDMGYGYGMFTVHDEIIISCKQEYAAICEAKLKEVMQSVGRYINLSVPLVAETSGPMNKWED